MIYFHVRRLFLNLNYISNGMLNLLGYQTVSDAVFLCINSVLTQVYYIYSVCILYIMFCDL